MVETLAHIFNLHNFVDIDNDNKNIPIKIFKLFINFKENSDIVLPRYFYYNDNMDMLVVQYGNCKTIDAMFVADNESIRLEIKQIPAKLEEIDINSYDEDGKLVLTNEFCERNKVYIPFINIFNKRTSIFNEIGKNFKLSQFLNDDNIHNLLKQVILNKKIDIFLFLKDMFIYPILPENFVDNISFEGSEIRTSGRNSTNIFTKKYFSDVINSLKGYINDNIVYVPLDKVKTTIGRGKSEITRININEFFYADINKVKYDKNLVVINLSDIKQKKPTISLHLSSNFKNEIIFAQIKDLYKN